LLCFLLGLGGIYRGLFPTILKQGSNQGIRFFTFHEVRKILQGGDKKEALGVLQSLAAGAIAGGASVLGNNPIDVVKSRMQGLEAHKYKSSWDCAKRVIQTDGILG
jgi:solute carrier family 25 (mitochondrial citrate transporter), member 1